MKFSKITLKTDYPITDFAAERNKLLSEAKTEWVLFVDSDEEVTPELEREIERIEDPPSPRLRRAKDGYFIRRKDFFLGKWLEHGETGNIKLLRLGRKDAGRWRRPVHEYWEIKNPGQLKNSLLHYPNQTIFDFIKSINHYSDIHAKELGKLSCLDLIKPMGKFFVNYFVWLGFLDGTSGFVHAFMMSFQSLVTRVKQYDFFQNSSTAG